MKTAQLKTKWELFKFRTSIIFYSWLTLLFISTFAILKLSQMQDYKNDTFASVSRVHTCIFVDELRLTHGISILKGCEGFVRFKKISEIEKVHDRLIYSPIFSILLVFSMFGLVLQNNKRKMNDGNIN